MGEVKRRRSVSTPYRRDEDIRRMVVRLATHGDITDDKVEAVARAVHGATGVAGTPIPWDKEGWVVRGVYWDERGRQRYRDEARMVMEHARGNNGEILEWVVYE